MWRQLTSIPNPTQHIDSVVRFMLDFCKRNGEEKIWEFGPHGIRL
jgi:hypothetical protein